MKALILQVVGSFVKYTACRMLCCGRRKERGFAGIWGCPWCQEQPERVEDMAHGGARQKSRLRQIQAATGEVIQVQPDFRRVSGISTEIFNQIRAVENDGDATTAAATAAAEKRGEMVIRVLDSCKGSDGKAESADSDYVIQTVEINKRPGQTLGLYIREGDGFDRQDGVFISRIALGSAVDNSGILKVGDEILSVNSVDVRNICIDDVVIIMSIPRRLVLTLRTRKCTRRHPVKPVEQKAPVVIVKREFLEDTEHKPFIRKDGEVEGIYTSHMQDDQYLYYNSQPQEKYRPPSRARAAYGEYEHDAVREPVITQQPQSTFYPKISDHLLERIQSIHAGSRILDSKGQPIPRQPVTSGRLMHPSHSDRYLRTGHPRQTGIHGMHRVGSEHRFLYEEPHAEYIPHHGRPPYDMSMQYRDMVDRTRYHGDWHPGGRRREHRRASSIECASDSEIHYAYRDAKPSTLARQGSLDKPYPRHAYQSRSNSLPRVKTGEKHKHTVRFYNDTITSEAQEDSDGAVSAPELPWPREKYDRVRMQRMDTLPARSSSRGGDIFASQEYRAWLSRAPSTSAIYERLRRSREELRALKLSRIHSAECLMDHARYGELSDAMREQHLSTLIRSLSKGLRTSSSSSLHGIPAYAAEETPRRYILKPTPSRITERNGRWLDVNPAEYLKYKVDKSDDMQRGDGISGILTIHVCAGRYMKTSATKDRYRDLYCVVEVDRVHRARTMVRTGDQNFDWDEVFEIDLMDNRELELLIYSWDQQHRHKLCYKGLVYLGNLFKDSDSHQLALKLEPRGTLYMKLIYTEPRFSFKRAPAKRRNALFGVDLETTVARENTELNLPILIKRCVEEVERRGLDLVGLYRLCGNAAKKKQLRDAFERNPQAVDLSQDSVPDISVITGVLKDYLRELPEPLFTNCLYQMLQDALSVCIPEDPEGNAKLVLSIFDCLPKVNKTTLTVILDHLKLVASQSSRNRMTTESLAEQFGPVLFLASTTDLSSPKHYRKPMEVLRYLLDVWPPKSSM